mgnify:CR=1 FL=1
MRAQKISATIAGLGLAGLLAAPLMPAANAIPIIPGGGSGGGNAAAADENTADGGDNAAADTDKDGAGNENNGTISGLDDEADGAAAGGNGKSITSTVTTTTTPAPAGNGAGANATATEPAPAGAADAGTGAGTNTGADQAAQNPAAQPMQEELALTGNSTQVFAATLAVLALLAAGGYVVAMRRTV